MTWLVVALAAAIGLVNHAQDGRAMRLCAVAFVLAAALAWLERWCSLPTEVIVPRALDRFGGAPGTESVPRFLPAAHLAYPVLVRRAIAPLGSTASLFGMAIIALAITLALAVGHAVVDVTAGVLLGVLLAPLLSGWRLSPVTNRASVENPTRLSGDSASRRAPLAH